MKPDQSRSTSLRDRSAEWWQDARRAFNEFLRVPASLVAAFAVLAIATAVIDAGLVQAFEPLRGALRRLVFTEAQATAAFLGVVASSLIAMTAFSFGLLLLAVQQTAASMTSYVVDQFLRRRINQVYFGFFVGLALYALIVLATTGTGHNPVVGASLALVLMAVALCLLILLLYTTVNQIRPAVVIEALHEITLEARRSHLALLRRTRRRAMLGSAAEVPVRAANDGYVVHIEAEQLAQAMAAQRDEAEVVFLVSIGSFVAWGDMVAIVRARSREQAQRLEPAAWSALLLEQQRDLDRDPAFGIEEIETIGWTSASSSKSNPAPALLAIRSLRDLLARWIDPEAGDDGIAAQTLPVVMTDNVLARAMDALETLAVASTESMQHQCFAEVVRALAALFGRLPPGLRARAADMTLRILSGLGDHVLTADLENALDALAIALSSGGNAHGAQAVRGARQSLQATLGRLGSRSSRGAT